MTDVNIRELFPAFLLADRNGFALAKAIGAGLTYFLEKCQDGLDMITDIDKMPEWRLDDMAWELNVTWYNSAGTVEEKRQTIKDARKSYGILGTPQSILLAFRGEFGDGQVQEWWEYDGDPYHFRVFTVRESTMGADYERIMGIINAVKNVRSIVDGIYYRGDSGTAAIWALAGCAAITHRDRGHTSNNPNEV